MKTIVVSQQIKRIDGMTKEELEGVANREGKARERYSCSLFFRNTWMGSGTFVSLASRKFIITADHVIDGARWEMDEANKELVGISTRNLKCAIPAKTIIAHRLRNPRGYGPKGPDIALLEFCPSDQTGRLSATVSFYPIERIIEAYAKWPDELPRHQSGILVIGRPKERIDAEGLHPLVYITRRSHYTNNGKLDWWRLPVAGAEHIASLGGVSGGGIWGTDQSGSALYGVVFYEYFRPKRQVIGHGPFTITQLVAKASGKTL